jgi:hypothetical protein
LTWLRFFERIAIRALNEQALGEQRGLGSRYRFGLVSLPIAPRLKQRRPTLHTSAILSKPTTANDSVIRPRGNDRE